MVCGFESGVDDGAHEGVEAVVVFAFACFGVEGCVGRGVTELFVEAVLPFCSFGFIVEFGVCLPAGLFPTEVVCEFVSFGRFFLEITRMAYRIGFGLALVNNFAMVVTIDFTAVDDTVRCERSFYLLYGKLIDDFCHNGMILLVI